MLAPPPVVCLLLIVLAPLFTHISGVTFVFLSRNKERRFFDKEVGLNCKVSSYHAWEGLLVLT